MPLAGGPAVGAVLRVALILVVARLARRRQIYDEFSGRSNKLIAAKLVDNTLCIVSYFHRLCVWDLHLTDAT
jgi:hypothetical protein